MSSSVHGLGSEVASGEPVGHHDRVQGRGGVLDTSVDPPVLGVGLFNDVVAGLVGLDGHDLLHEVGDALGAAADLLAGVVELVEATVARNDLELLVRTLSNSSMDCFHY